MWSECLLYTGVMLWAMYETAELFVLLHEFVVESDDKSLSTVKK